MVERRETILAVEETQDEHAGRGEQSSELAQRTAEFGWWQMDQRVPGQDPGDGSLSRLAVDQRPQSELRTGMGHPSVSNELGHHVDPGNVDAEPMQMSSPLAGAAAKVEDRAWQAREVLPDQGGIGIVRIYLVEQLDVLARHARVRVTDSLEFHPHTVGATSRPQS